MRRKSPNFVLVTLLATLCILSSCGKNGEAQAPPVNDPLAQEESVPKLRKPAAATKLERINIAEIGKLRSRTGKEVIVSGKVSGTSTSRSGHHFLNFPNGFKVVCLNNHVGNFTEGGPAALYLDKLVEVRGTISSHQGKPQISIASPDQVVIIDLAKKGGGGSSTVVEEFELREVAPNSWLSPAGLRYVGRDPQGLTRKDHVLRHAKDQPNRAGSHGVFDADGDEVFEVIDEAWELIEKKNIRPRTEGDSQTYTVPMGRRIGYLGGKNGARRNHPALKSVFIVVRKGKPDVITAFPK